MQQVATPKMIKLHENVYIVQLVSKTGYLARLGCQPVN